MDVRAHRRILERAIDVSGAAWAGEARAELLRGSEDEDVYLIPLLGLRLRAVGFTHTQRPGSAHGEWGAPSALVMGRRRLAQAREAWRADRGRAAYLVGRVAHLLVDAGVPARTRGVWHMLGDPLEQWIEGRADAIREQALVEPPAAATLDALFESLSGLASRFPADTTRTPWGLLRFAAGRGLKLSEREVAEQARVLVPAAVAHVAGLLRLPQDWG
ncbi:MAG: hypothetical protein HY553_11770 [Elusimicrobia bacterium]|nr:hypothetical protein [Elusimicrobiota bacterium]